MGGGRRLWWHEIRLRTGRPRPQITRIPNFSISLLAQALVSPLSCDVCWHRVRGRTPGQMVRRHQEVTTRLVWEARRTEERYTLTSSCFNISLINILIMLCARWALWMQPRPLAAPAPSPSGWWMSPGQAKIVFAPRSPAKALLPPPSPSPGQLTGHRYKLPSPYTFHWIKYSEIFLSLVGEFLFIMTFLYGSS